jgi:hypothetical protein
MRSGILLKIAYFLGNYIGSGDWQCHIQVDAFICVVLSKAEKHMPYGELVGTTKCITL